MFERILPKQYGYFDLFERHTLLTREAIQHLIVALNNLGENKGEIARIEECEHEADSVTHMTVDLLRRSYITPFDREEIRELITRLDDITDYVEATAHRLDLFEIRELPADMLALADVLQRSQEHLIEVVKALRTMKDREGLTAHCREINRLENEGDRINRSGIAALFRSGRDPLYIIKVKEIYEILEEAIDRCEDVVQVVEGIVIEHVG